MRRPERNPAFHLHAIPDQFLRNRAKPGCSPPAQKLRNRTNLKLDGLTRNLSRREFRLISVSQTGAEILENPVLRNRTKPAALHTNAVTFLFDIGVKSSPATFSRDLYYREFRIISGLVDSSVFH